jgi:NhaA family Na+:H+ antiporter
VLLLAALTAFAAANSPWAAGYADFWHTEIGLSIGEFAIARPLEWIVNDGLMVIFFFVVGLEIRREIHEGELSELRRAALPLIAALGGVVAPALIYIAMAGAPETRHGWAVPTATDIAFAVGVLALLGRRVPPALRVLLLALAVIDDLVAILVIAVFYSDGVAWVGLAVAAAGVALILTLKWAGVRRKAAYIAPGLIVWAGVYAAGVHPTIAGVLVGMMTPVQAWLGADGFLEVAPRQIAQLERVVSSGSRDAHALSVALRPISSSRREALSPAESLIELLHPWVAFAIMPLFALANAGVTLGGNAMSAQSSTIAWAASVGLVLGKPLGIVALSYLAVRLGVVRLPRGLSTVHLTVLGLVAGVGFTMALFIAQLAFSNVEDLNGAKLGVLCGSVVAGVAALIAGKLLLPLRRELGMAEHVDEAERSTDA